MRTKLWFFLFLYSHQPKIRDAPLRCPLTTERLTVILNIRWRENAMDDREMLQTILNAVSAVTVQLDKMEARLTAAG